ncbi:MAG: hypothetical protein A3G41_05710 [Elusimicrobia bacterium RIFCSPLOWO2_12_FULL_59_9]|nr:MAG: hypothetical protein A3G41_05710 [Elusimicrobia bacterium RIFCSPLOWO2_12_FULL_59_9]
MGHNGYQPWLEKGITFYNARKYPDAVRSFETSIRCGDKNVSTQCYLVHAYLSLGKNRQAVQLLKKTFLSDTPTAPVLMVMGDILERSGKLAEATDCLKRAVATSPDSAKAWFKLGGICVKLGRMREAEAHLRQAVRLDNHLPQGHLLLGSVLDAQQHPEEAEKLYRAALRLEPRSFDVLLLLGEVLIKKGRWKEAEAHLREALCLDRRSLDAGLLLGLVLHKKGRTEEAMRSFRTASQFAPRDFKMSLRLAEFCMHRGWLKKAETFLRRAVRLNSQSPQACLWLGNVLEARGFPETAEKKYRKAARLSRHHFQMCLRLGKFFAQRGWLVEAEALLRRAILLNSGSSEGYLELAEFLRGQARFGEAIRAFQAGKKRDPSSSDFDFRLGRLYQQLGRPTPMTACFRRALKSAGAAMGSGMARFQAWMALGNYRRAFAEAERVLNTGDVGDCNRFFRPWGDNFLFPQPQSFFLSQLGKLERAERQLHGSPWFRYYRGLLLWRLNRTEESLAELNHLTDFPQKRYGWMRHVGGFQKLRLGLYRVAVDDLRATLSSKPDAWWARGLLAEAYLCLGNTHAALTEFDKAERFREALSELWAWRGEALLWIGRNEEALRYLNRAISAGSWLAVCWRGAAFMLMGKFKEALSDLDRAIVPGSMDAEAFVWRGEVKRRMGRNEQSLADLDRAIELQGGTWAYVNRGLTNASLRNWKGMRKDFDHVPIEFVSYVRQKLGLPMEKVLYTGETICVLETALELAHGLRRHEPYLNSIWMVRKKNRGPNEKNA